MSQFDDTPPPSRARRSPLFRSRPDALQVDEWVANITLPPPPDIPLEEEDPAEQLDEHGLPSFDDVLDEPEELGTQPARLFVGMGQRGASVASQPQPGDEDEDEFLVGDDDFFVAELRLPRPEDRVPFRMGSSADDDDEEASSNMLLDADEASEPSLAIEGLDVPFSISLEAPDPVYFDRFDDQASVEEDDDSPVEFPDTFADPDDEEFSSEDLDELVSAGLPPLSLQPSLAREPLHLHRRQLEPPEPEPEPEPEPQLDPGPPPPPPQVWSRPGGASTPEPDPPEETPEQDEEPVSDPRSGKPPQVIRSRPSWAPGRPVKDAAPLNAPVYQPREPSASSAVREKLFSWTGLSILVAALIIALALWVLVRG